MLIQGKVKSLKEGESPTIISRNLVRIPQKLKNNQILARMVGTVSETASTL
jgi:hypothetical protein